MEGRLGDRLLGRRAAVLPGVALAAACGACSVLPAEFNLSPLYRHRVDAEGRLLELDVLWPLVHFQRTAEGGTDLRLRPFYRRLGGQGVRTEHQFLWPLGRIRSDEEEDHGRLFPVVSYRDRIDHQGRPDLDWHVFPLVWGGRGGDDEDYLAVLPVYGSIPDFLTYDRYGWFLWPLFSWTRKGDQRGRMFLVFVAGWGTSEREDGPTWWRVLPFYGQSVHPGRHSRHSALWPFLHWGREREHQEHPVSYWMFWPLLGNRRGGDHESSTFLFPFFHFSRDRGKAVALEDLRPWWTAIFPFFHHNPEAEEVLRWDGPWPFVRYHRDGRTGSEGLQWWVWPLVAHTRAPGRESVVLAWPLAWLRRFEDGDVVRRQRYALPFAWHHETVHGDGRREEAVRIFPALGARRDSEGAREVRLLDPIPYEHGGRDGFTEHYGFLWTILHHARDGRGGSRTELPAAVVTHRREAGGESWASVPLLFSRHCRPDGSGRLWLFNLIPVPWGPSREAAGEDGG